MGASLLALAKSIYYLYLTNRKKAGKRHFSSFFEFLPFSSKSKKVDFFPLSLFGHFGRTVVK